MKYESGLHEEEVPAPGQSPGGGASPRSESRRRCQPQVRVQEEVPESRRRCIRTALHDSYLLRNQVNVYRPALLNVILTQLPRDPQSRECL
ncbi:hypothetical protein KUCAC02_030090 [Chaenocephalus aceratus]|uniref:Uncharacterized protein n=1 Tax=Chaenocephalus aceratus TaxID=36190 RepID=A0ACB9XJ33_CHAAC|nr:hypothetical protein KUCAC02_030090 [Chaenocephalus aceratus]